MKTETKNFRNQLKRGFTLIELLAVLIILAILALVVTPVVFNVIKKAEEGSFRTDITMVMNTVALEATTEKMNLTYNGTMGKTATEYSGDIDKLEFKGSNYWTGTWTYDLTNETVTLINAQKINGAYQAINVNSNQRPEEYTILRIGE